MPLLYLKCLTVYRRPPSLKHALVIGISQSGQSPDIVSVLEEARRQGCPTLAIANDETSPLARMAQYIIPLHAGKERAVAATKTYTASLAAVASFSACLANDSDMLNDLKRLPDWMNATLSGLDTLHRRAERYRYMTYGVVVGRGYNYATAFEIALKLKELTGIVVEPYSPADFLHGAIAMIHGTASSQPGPTGAVHSGCRGVAGGPAPAGGGLGGPLCRIRHTVSV